MSRPAGSAGAGDDASPTFLADELTDRLMQVCVELGAELWVVKQRLAVLEERLADRGVLAEGEVDGPALAVAGAREERRRTREAFIDRIYRPLVTPASQPAGGSRE